MPIKYKPCIDDGFNSELVKNAYFDGDLEIPKIKPLDIKSPEFSLPSILVPFSQLNRVNDKNKCCVFYENDINFGDILKNPDKYLDDLKTCKYVVSPDNSLYRDMPLVTQLMNIYRNRALGYFFQSKGLNVITNIRWGDERTFSTDYFPDRVAFLGAPKNNIIAIGTYGCSKLKEDKFYLEQGFNVMMEYLSPKVVIVYGTLPKEIKQNYKHVKIVEYENFTSFIHKK